ncbi:hypothetical protein HanIR_Chr04g0199581 [Helianthus annuus]|nr:hypothetical protein HanIR_Chr04g0199581 [Helianthus annuus]
MVLENFLFFFNQLNTDGIKPPSSKRGKGSFLLVSFRYDFEFRSCEEASGMVIKHHASLIFIFTYNT